MKGLKHLKMGDREAFIHLACISCTNTTCHTQMDKALSFCPQKTRLGIQGKHRSSAMEVERKERKILARGHQEGFLEEEGLAEPEEKKVTLPALFCTPQLVV